MPEFCASSMLTCSAPPGLNPDTPDIPARGVSDGGDGTMQPIVLPGGGDAVADTPKAPRSHGAR